MDKRRDDLLKSSDQFKNADTILSTGFSLQNGQSYFDDFPVWKTLESELWGSSDSTELIGTTGLRTTTLRIQNETVKVGLIGAVATTPHHRGKGIASHLVQKLLDKAASEGCAFAILWGSEYELYNRLGFELCGEQFHFALSELEGIGEIYSHYEIEITSKANHDLFQMRQDQKFGLALSDKDISWWALHKNVSWYLAKDRATKKLVAYAAIHRGIDLKNTVHEWGGNKDALCDLFSSILKDNEDAALIANSTIAETLPFEIPKIITPQFLFMAKVLDPNALLSLSCEHTEIRVEKQEGEMWRFFHSTDSEKTLFKLSTPQLARYFFGPFEPNTGIYPRRPLPIWIWGLDAC